MAKRKFPNLRDSSWERGYQSGMATVRGNDGYVTHYNPEVLEASLNSKLTSREQWTIRKKLVERRKREAERMQSS